MKNVLKFRAWDERRKSMEYIDDLYWFEENGVHDENGVGHNTKYILMQSIGLDDKNGEPAFESDFVKDKEGLVRIFKREISCGSCCTQVVGFGASGEGHTDFIYLDQSNNDFEIIGNIYENPELMELVK